MTLLKMAAFIINEHAQTTPPLGLVDDMTLLKMTAFIINEHA